MNQFWNWVKDEDTGQRTLYLNGAIAEDSWFDDEVTPKAFKSDLNAGEGDIVIGINSPGAIALQQAKSTLCSWTIRGMSR